MKTKLFIKKIPFQVTVLVMLLIQMGNAKPLHKPLIPHQPLRCQPVLHK